MANKDQVRLIRQGAEAWNAWRCPVQDSRAQFDGSVLLGDKHINPEERAELLKNARRIAWMSSTEQRMAESTLTAADLRGVDLSGADLSGLSLAWADLRYADLRNARLLGTDLHGAYLTGANLRHSDLTAADLKGAHLQGASLYQTNLTGARFDRADLAGADLRESYLIMASLVLANIMGCDLTGCHIYGISAWDPEIDEHTKQSNLIITLPGQAAITVDNLEVAQFIYLLLNNRSVRNIIDTLTSKVVLILGRFTSDRKTVLDGLREELGKRDYVPIMFDFDKPTSRSYRETVSTLARMARFVIADLTSAKVILQELELIAPQITSVPIQPILQSRAAESVTVEADYSPYPWVLPTMRYGSEEGMKAFLDEVIARAEATVSTLRSKRAQ